MDFDRKITTFLALTLVLSCEIIYADFGAYYTRLDYEDRISGKYADVVVSVGQGGRFVFSRQSSYLPYWETEKGKVI